MITHTGTVLVQYKWGMFFLVIINVGGTITHCPPPGAEDKFWAVLAGLGGSAAHTGRTAEIWPEIRHHNDHTSAALLIVLFNEDIDVYLIYTIFSLDKICLYNQPICCLSVTSKVKSEHFIIFIHLSINNKQHLQDLVFMKHWPMVSQRVPGSEKYLFMNFFNVFSLWVPGPETKSFMTDRFVCVILLSSLTWNLFYKNLSMITCVMNI